MARIQREYWHKHNQLRVIFDRAELAAFGTLVLALATGIVWMAGKFIK